MSHVYHGTIPGTLITISLQTAQLEAGSTSLLLTDPTPFLPYLTDSWITSVRNFLRANQLSLQFSKNWNFRLARVNDQMIMDSFRHCNRFTPTDLLNVNAVRLFLQVSTLSDISSADGKTLLPHILLGEPSTTRTSSINWPRQPSVTASQIHLW